ncbi:MAG: Peptidase, (Pitrilysin) family [Myxococcales bacterium]|nr:Peptidase, (Pitrilysin) family [Myxococcales bacterium]
MLALALGAGPAARPLPSAVHDVETHRFDNGLTLHIAAGDPRGVAAPVIAVQAWVGVGSADETPPQAGLAHVIEHMLFKGSTGYGVGELTRAIEASGGEINAWTSFDQTVFHAVLGRDHVDGAIDALGDTLTTPRVDPDELALERNVILEEIRQGSDDPARSVAQSLFATAYVSHPYRRPVIGTAESVRRFGERELVEFFRSYYVADNLTLVVAGDVDPARVRRSVERRFRAMPSGRPTRRVTAEPAQTSPRAVAAFRDVSEAYVAVGFHVPAARHPDVAALDVAAILLGESESARLPRRLRDRDQVVTGASAHIHALRDPGLFVLSATARPRDAQDSVAGLVDQALTLASEVTQDELDKARIAAEAGLVRQLETAQGRARSVGWNATVAGDPRFAHVYLDRIRAVRRHDVATAVDRYFRSDNATVAAILPQRAKGKTAVFAREAEKRVRRALAQAPVTPVPIEKRVTLANGAVLIVRRDPSVPVVAMRAVWRGGQRTEDAQHAGASTVIARMITRGCAMRDAAAVADRIDRLGGSLGGVTGRNSFGIASEWLARSWRDGLDLFGDCILDPTFAKAELDREKQMLLDDQIAQNDNPTQVAFRLFSETLYGDHPYARDVLGTAKSVGDLTRANVIEIYRERYPVSQMTLAVVGDVDIDEVIARVTKRFGAAPKATKASIAAKATKAAIAPKATNAPKPISTASDREVYRYLERAQAHLVIGYPGATVDAPDRFALEVLVAVLGGQSGRLFGELRDKQGLVYRVSAHSIEGIDPGFVAVYLSCAPEKLGAAVAAVRAELDRIRDSAITTEELVRARSYLIGSHQIAMQRRAAIANAIAYHEAYGLGWQTWATYDDAINAVTVDDVTAAAASYLKPELAITATVRPPAKTPAAKKRSKLTPASAPRSRGAS